LKEEISALILQVEGASGIGTIASVKKLKGYKDYYRFKVGDYRIGVKITSDTVTFVDIAHRKDIYKQIP
jgi:mRNA interferase RelE/StbE